MLELLASYSLGEVLIFIVVFALALKEFFNVFDFFKAKAKLWLTGEQEKEKNSVSLQELAEKIDKFGYGIFSEWAFKRNSRKNG